MLTTQICITYTIQFLDKLSLNYASAYTLIPDLGLEGQRYSWVAAIFNFGYLLWALPANYLIQRLPVAKYTGIMILIWSVLLCCHVAAKNYAGMLALRFLLGMFEASISPAIMNIVSMFYTRSEQPIRMCVFLAFNGVATMVGALLGYGLGHAHSPHIKTWQLIFLIIGLMIGEGGIVPIEESEEFFAIGSEIGVIKAAQRRVSPLSRTDSAAPRSSGVNNHRPTASGAGTNRAYKANSHSARLGRIGSVATSTEMLRQEVIKAATSQRIRPMTPSAVSRN